MTYEARAPDYKGDGIAIWKNYSKDGQLYLSVKLTGHNSVNAFKNEPKPKPAEEQEI